MIQFSIILNMEKLLPKFQAKKKTGSAIAAGHCKRWLQNLTKCWPGSRPA